jgi:AraC-like DNA-binding protein
VGDRDGSRLGALPTATGSITRLAYARAKEAGVDLEPILKKVGLTLHQIDDPGARLRVRDQISFLNLIASELQDDFLGFHLALPLDLRALGWLYYVSASSETMEEALRRAARYSSIANEGISLNHTDVDDVAMRINYVGVSRHADRHQIEFVVTALILMCRRLTGLRLMPIHTKFIHHREKISSDFFEFFGENVEFGAAVDEVAVAAAIKKLPVASADPYLSRLLIAYCEEALSRRPSRRDSFRAIVENAIVPLLPHGKARADEVARRLGISRRTFARRLSLEELTFSDVLASLRSDLAMRYLADANLSISQVAWLLGYQEVSAFTHAFKRWTGKTPREARSYGFSDSAPMTGRHGNDST